MPLGLLMTDPEELEMPSLVAQDHIGVASMFLIHELPLGQGPKGPQGCPGPQQDPAIPAERRQGWKCLQALAQPTAQRQPLQEVVSTGHQHCSTQQGCAQNSRLSCVSSTRSLWHSRKITRAPDSRPERNITALKQR